MNIIELSHHLKKFHLDENQIKIYLILCQLQTSTVVQISKHTDINRTTLYRILGQLEAFGLVEQVLGHKTTKYRALSPKQLEIAILREEEKIQDLRQSLNALVSTTANLIPSFAHPTQVMYFQGKEGLKQMLWNTLQVGKNGEIAGFGYMNLNLGAGKFFAEKVRQEYIANAVKKREILNIDQLEFEENYTNFAREYRKVYEGRGVECSKLEINHDTIIYNDVFAFYYQLNDELFGVEIHNAEIAKTQKQIFNLLWEMAKPKRDVLKGYEF